MVLKQLFFHLFVVVVHLKALKKLPYPQPFLASLNFPSQPLTLRYLAEPKNIFAEPIGPSEPTLKNTVLKKRKCFQPYRFLGEFVVEHSFPIEQKGRLVLISI